MKLTKPFNVVTVLIIFFLALLESFANASSRGKFRNLQGKKLRVVTGHFPPVISILRNSTGHIVGYADLLYEQLLYLSKSLNFTFDIFPSKENTNGIKLSNGTWNGIIGYLLREEADLGLVPIAITLERYEAIEFSGRLGGDHTAILVRYPEPSISFTGAFDVFPTGIWIGWIISWVAVVVVSVAVTCVTKHLRSGRSDGAGEQTASMQARNVAWYFFGTIVSQGLRFPSSYVSQRLLAAAWCLIAFVFVNVYCSTLTSYMSVTYQRPTINSVRDLAFTPSYKATVIAGSIQDIDLQRSRNEILKIIAERVEKCSSDCKKFNLIDLATTVLEKDNYVSILPYTVGILLLKKYNSERTQCRLALAYEIMSWKPMFLGVPKSSPYIEEINQGSLRFIDSGLRDYWYRNEEKLPAQCQLNYNSKGVASKRSSSRIKLEQFYLPFLILFAGYLLALAQFCREQIGRCLSTKKNLKLVILNVKNKEEKLSPRNYNGRNIGAILP